MILGMTTSVFTEIHVAISLIAIATGFIVVLGMLSAMRLPLWTTIFLATTVATSVTGFFFPFHGVTPGIILGVLSLVVLLLAILALYRFHLLGRWRSTYVVSSVLALYFNVFVAIAQSFQKIPALKGLAPTQSEPPFLIAQLVVMAVFITLGILAVKKFHPTPVPIP